MKIKPTTTSLPWMGTEFLWNTKNQERSSCVFTMCLLHNIFPIWLSIDIYLSLVFLISDICFLGLLFSSRGVSWGCWSAERKNRIISQPFKRMVELWIWNALQLKKHQIIRETCCEFVFRLLHVFWVPFCKSDSITIAIWVLTNHVCLNHKSFGHLKQLTQPFRTMKY